MLCDQIARSGVVIPTGSLGLDIGLGGGLPVGFVTRLYGEQKSGKSTWCMKTAANALDMGYEVLWIDAEDSLLQGLAAKNGLDLSRVDVAGSFDGHVLTYEEAIAIINTALFHWYETGKHGLIVIDSLDALPTQGELDAEVSDAKIASAARVSTRWLKTGVNAKLRWTDSALVFIQQLRANLDGRYEKTKTSGGWMLEHNTQIEIQLKPVKKLAREREIIGAVVNWTIKKSKPGRAGVAGEYHLRFDEGIGIDRAAEIVALGTRCGVIHKSGSYYRFTDRNGEEHSVQGANGLRSWLGEQPERAKWLEDRISEAFGLIAWDEYGDDDEDHPLPIEAVQDDESATNNFGF